MALTDTDIRSKVLGKLSTHHDELELTARKREQKKVCDLIAELPVPEPALPEKVEVEVDPAELHQDCAPHMLEELRERRAKQKHLAKITGKSDEEFDMVSNSELDSLMKRVKQENKEKIDRDGPILTGLLIEMMESGIGTLASRFGFDGGSYKVDQKIAQTALMEILNDSDELQKYLSPQAKLLMAFGAPAIGIVMKGRKNTGACGDIVHPKPVITADVVSSSQIATGYVLSPNL